MNLNREKTHGWCSSFLVGNRLCRLRGADHNYTERKVTRVWGRRRLKLIEGLLPFAESVQVYLRGRALPSFYAVELAGMTFVLGLSGFSESSFTATGGFDLLGESAAADDALLGPALDLLQRDIQRSVAEVAQTLGTDEGRATRLLVRLCRQGRCMFDVESRRYRHRELFEEPADELKYFPPDLRRELAAKLIAAGAVHVETCCTQETTKTRRLKTPDGPVDRQITYRDWHVNWHGVGRSFAMSRSWSTTPAASFSAAVPVPFSTQT